MGWPGWRPLELRDRYEHVFDRLSPMGPAGRRAPLRWKLAEEDQTQALFPDETAMERHVGTGEFRGMEFLHVNSRSIINEVPASSRMPFRYTINAYRGCSHACVFCFARPTHEYLGLNTGEDFERRIVVKVNAVERLRAELRSAKWHRDHIAMGTNTDPYQHAEGKYHLTKGIVKALGEFRNPFSILTKSTLVLRDLRLLTEAASRTSVRCNVSIGTLDRDVWKLTEPGTPPPDRRVEVVRRLNDAGVPCGVLIAPILPGLSDTEEQVRQVTEACIDAGAVSVSAVGLHLRPGVREHFMAWLEQSCPDLVPLYRKRFARGSYQPKAEQAKLGTLVSELTDGPGPRYVQRYDTRGVGKNTEDSETGEPKRIRDGGEVEDTEQLRLM
jgi:DNA repair photolyase